MANGISLQAMANLAIHHDKGVRNFERHEITKKVQQAELKRRESHSKVRLNARIRQKKAKTKVMSVLPKRVGEKFLEEEKILTNVVVPEVVVIKGKELMEKEKKKIDLEVVFPLKQEKERQQLQLQQQQQIQQQQRIELEKDVLRMRINLSKKIGSRMKLEKIVKRLDKEHDGTLSHEEFNAMLHVLDKTANKATVMGVWEGCWGTVPHGNDTSMSVEKIWNYINPSGLRKKLNDLKKT